MLEGMRSERQHLADQLEGVLAGTVDLQAVLEDAMRFNGPLAHCYSNLFHFLSDADIRARDPAWRTMQESEMRKLMVLLRSEAPATKLGRISFLDASPD